MYKKKLTADFPFGWGEVLSTLIDDAKGYVSSGLFNPPVNIKEDDKGYTISMLAPGFKKENFQVKSENNVLEISAKCSEESEAKWIRREWVMGDFSRRFTIKGDADQNSISARYEDGVLEVLVAKKKETHSKNEIRVM
jgi:HSP20 family protein